MLFVVGIVIVFGSVLYGFVMSHGQLLALWQPFEILIIVGAAFGAFLLSNPWHVVMSAFRMVPQVVMGSRVNKAMYMDVLGLLYDILNKARREGIMAIESDVESPESSALFARYPAIQLNHELANFIADYFRIIAAGNLTSFELESLMDQEIEARLHELEQPGIAVAKVSDALPGFGIVAAVLGIVITMGAIGGDINEIGGHVAAALVGTFSGVLLAYGMVGPIASVMRHIAEDEIKLYEASKSCIIASLNGLPPQLAVEFGRKSLFTHGRPTFDEVESKVRSR
ncbi:MAG: flagellar motor stator protein MotA [Alcanivorax sp.]|jgi:chemotaxis protein MotA|tara:strand:- start:2776 stop:3627 length:852 start_codon:yes stop_codon:yes gene_type:complete